jgi:hypothetical protein
MRITTNILLIIYYYLYITTHILLLIYYCSYITTHIHAMTKFSLRGDTHSLLHRLPQHDAEVTIEMT